MNANAVVFEFRHEAGWMLVIQEHMHRYAPVEATETFYANEKLSVILSHLGRTTGGEGVGYDLHEETSRIEGRVLSFSVHKPRTVRSTLFEPLRGFYPGSEIVNLEVNNLPRRVGATLAEISSEIEYLNLTPALSAGARDGLVYFPDDTHWTPAGHRITAAVISEHVSHY